MAPLGILLRHQYGLGLDLLQLAGWGLEIADLEFVDTGDVVPADWAVVANCAPFPDAVEAVGVRALDATDHIWADVEADGAEDVVGLIAGDHVFETGEIKCFKKKMLINKRLN